MIFYIDGIDYTNKIIRDRPFVVHIMYEDIINNSVCSTLNVSLYEDGYLQSIFPSISAFSIFSQGFVRVRIRLDFSTYTLFEGYIDPSLSNYDKDKKIIDLTVIGIEKQIFSNFNNFDISQLYYNLSGNTSTRQRGGRQGIPRISYEIHNRIETLILTMFQDMNLNNSLIYFNHIGENKLVYKYDKEKIGDIHRNKSIITIRNAANGGRIIDTSSYYEDNFINKEKESLSYSTLLKELASLTNCIIGYDYYNSMIFFINRDYNFCNDFGKIVFKVDNYVQRDNYKSEYKYISDGILLKFDDVSIALKRTQGIVPGYNFEYGFMSDDYIRTYTQGQYYLVKPEDPITYLLGGGSRYNNAIYLRNPIELNFGGRLHCYLKDISIEDFLITYIYDNYENLLNRNQECQITVPSYYPAPFRIELEGQEYNVFDTTIDLINDTTTMKFLR